MQLYLRCIALHCGLRKCTLYAPGGNTAGNMEDSVRRYSLSQVNYLRSHNARTSNCLLLAVSLSSDCFIIWRRMFSLQSLYYEIAFVRLPMLFSGDIESNSSPNTKNKGDTLTSVLATVQRIQQGQMLNEIKPLGVKRANNGGFVNAAVV